MPRQVSRYPTELEEQILKTLWRQAPLLAREVQAALAEDGRRSKAMICGAHDRDVLFSTT